MMPDVLKHVGFVVTACGRRGDPSTGPLERRTPKQLRITARAHDQILVGRNAARSA